MPDARAGAKAEEELRRVEGEMEALRRERDELLAKLLEFETQKESANGVEKEKGEGEREEWEEWEREREEREREREEEREKLAALECELEEEREVVMSLRATISKLAEATEEREEEMEKHRREAQVMGSELEEARGSVAELTRKVRKMEEVMEWQLEEARAGVDAVRGEKEGEAEKLREGVSEMEAAVEAMQEEVMRLKFEKDEEVLRLEKEKDEEVLRAREISETAKNAELEEVRGEREALSASLSAAEASLADLRNDLDAERCRAEELQSEVSRAKTIHEQARVALVEAEDGRLAALGERDALSAELSNAQCELEGLREIARARQGDSEAAASAVILQGERDAAVKERNAVLAERDALLDEKNAASGLVHVLQEDKAGMSRSILDLTVARDALGAENAALCASKDELEGQLRAAFDARDCAVIPHRPPQSNSSSH